MTVTVQIHMRRALRTESPLRSVLLHTERESGRFRGGFIDAMHAWREFGRFD
jgi:hypothetical protein